MKLWSPSNKWVTVFGNPFPLSEVIKLSSILLLLVFIVSGFASYFYMDNLLNSRNLRLLVEGSEEGQKEEYKHIVDSAGKKEVGSFVELMDEHLQQSGFEKVHSLHAEGRFIIDGQVLDFLLLSRRPDYCRLQFSWPSGFAVSGHNGNNSWSSGADLLEDLFSVETQFLNKRLTRFLGIFPAGDWIYSKLGDQKKWKQSNLLEWESSVEWMGRKCKMLTNRCMGDSVIRHYFDLDTGLEISREVQMSLNGSDETYVQVHFKEPLGKIYQFPSGFELWMDGRKLGIVEFTHCEANRGLYSYLFEPPGKTESEGL